jgi:hypothetical protein
MRTRSNRLEALRGALIAFSLSLALSASLSVGKSLAADDGDELSAATNARLGPLSLEQPLSLAKTRLPQCQFLAGPKHDSEATGLTHQRWEAKNCGLTLEAARQAPEDPWTVYSITQVAPGKLLTDKGIGLGAEESALRRAYVGVINTEESTPGERWVVGSIYGGVMFSVKAGRVTKIFIGAAAE